MDKYCLMGDKWERVYAAVHDLDIVGMYNFQNAEDPFLYWLFERYGEPSQVALDANRAIRLPLSHGPYCVPSPRPEKVYVINHCVTCAQRYNNRQNVVSRVYIPPEHNYSYDDTLNPLTMNFSDAKGQKNYKFLQHHRRKEHAIADTHALAPWYPEGLPITSRYFSFPSQLSNHLMLNHIHYYKHSDKSSPFEYIRHYFDFDFCKVAYDGTRVSVYHWDSLFHRAAHVNVQRYIAIHEREISNPHPPDDIPKDLMERVAKRMEKYKKRGFSVEFC
jgi:hypothetical protein